MPSTRADAAPEGVKDCPILIENAAGAGGTVGRSFEEIKAIIDATGGDERIGLCIDTQHLWASGYDYSSTHATNKLVHEIDMSIGLDRLRCFHLNDSKTELGGNRDRHANIGEGTIGTEGLAALVGHHDFRDLPLLLEVPGTGEGPRWEDVIAARKVVVEGIKLYDGEVSAELEAFVLELPPAATHTPAKKKPAKKSAAKKTAPAKKAPVKKARGQEVTSKEVTSEEDCRQEDAYEESACEEGRGEEVTSEEVTSEEVTSEEVASEEVTSEEVTGEEVTSEEDRCEEVTSAKKSSCEESIGKEAHQEIRQEKVAKPR